MNESLRQALVEFLNLQGEAVYPTAGVAIYSDSTYGLMVVYENTPGDSVYFSPEPQDLAQFLLEYSII